MSHAILNSRLLRRYWFETGERTGFGVTAYSVEDARALLDEADCLGPNISVRRVVEDVDVRALDEGHVIPNMGPPNLRGVWYPRLNL